VVEHLLGKEKVGGSIPPLGSIRAGNLAIHAVIGQRLNVKPGDWDLAQVERIAELGYIEPIIVVTDKTWIAQVRRRRFRLKRHARKNFRFCLHEISPMMALTWTSGRGWAGPLVSPQLLADRGG
jgi:hypothetical protein